MLYIRYNYKNGFNGMLKRLDKYMDNLKSPYWEVYFWIIVIAIGIAGTAVIFIDPMGLAGKFGNAGSFLGGLFTIVAVFIAVIAYKASKKEHKENLLFEIKSELEIEFLPELRDLLVKYVKSLVVNLGKIRRKEDITNEIKTETLKIRSELKINTQFLKNKTLYLSKLGGLDDEYRQSYEDLKYFMSTITMLLDIVLSHIENTAIDFDKLEQELDLINRHDTFCHKYILDSLEHHEMSISKFLKISNEISKIILDAKRFYDLEPNQF